MGSLELADRSQMYLCILLAHVYGDALHAGGKAGSPVHMHVILRVLCVTYSGEGDQVVSSTIDDVAL